MSEKFESRGETLEFSKAGDWLELSESDYEKFADRGSGLRNSKLSSVPGALVCWIIHQQVWRTCLEDGELEGC